MAIDYRHKEYSAHIESWSKIDNVCEGKNVDEYLITLNDSDISPENAVRNKKYRERAVFYRIAGRTTEGLTGLIFSEAPNIVLPTELEYMKSNCDGAGVSILQQSQETTTDVIKIARGGLFVTYPAVDKELSKADMADGSYFATIHEYDAKQILNWEYTKVGSMVKLSLVVIMESVEVPKADDDYEKETKPQIRELMLIDGVFVQRLWHQDKDKVWFIVEDSEQIPRDGSGKSWDVIPFTFVGALSNSYEVDDSIMEGLVDLNIAHYRNSADYEDNVWFVGQTQPWMSGVNQNHIDLMEKNNMYIGSRSLLAVPQGEQFGFANASPNPLVRQSMLDKLDGMIGMGARFIQPGGANVTATKTNSDDAIAHSSLSMIAKNVSDAYLQCLKWAARYMNVNDSKIEFELNDEFIQPTATAQDIQAMVAGFLQGAIPAKAYLNWLKKMDIEEKDKDLEEFASELGSATMPNLESN